MLYTGERNYGCRFLEVSLFGLRTIILENEKIRLMFLLDQGTNMVEFNHKETDTDFLWRTPLGLSCLRQDQLAHGDHFNDTYTGGWFEAFPNVGMACTYRQAPLNSYAEVAHLPWEYAVVRDDPAEVSLHCRVRTVKTPFLVEKTFTVKANQPTLFIEEQVTNLGREPMDFQWGHHSNFGRPFLDGHCLIDLPGGDINVYVAPETSRVRVGTTGAWPTLNGKDGQPLDLRLMPPPGAEVNDLLWLTNLRGHWAAVRNLQRGVGFGLAWDPVVFKHCLLWIVANGDTGYPRYGDTYVLCVLPKNTDVHNLDKAVAARQASVLEPGRSQRTWLTATAFAAGAAVTGIDRSGRVTTASA
jgi:hypothetical protein